MHQRTLTKGRFGSFGNMVQVGYIVLNAYKFRFLDSSTVFLFTLYINKILFNIIINFDLKILHSTTEFLSTRS